MSTHCIGASTNLWEGLRFLVIPSEKLFLFENSFLRLGDIFRWITGKLLISKFWKLNSQTILLFIKSLKCHCGLPIIFSVIISHIIVFNVKIKKIIYMGMYIHIYVIFSELASCIYMWYICMYIHIHVHYFSLRVLFCVLLCLIQAYLLKPLQVFVGSLSFNSHLSSLSEMPCQQHHKTKGCQ